MHGQVLVQIQSYNVVVWIVGLCTPYIMTHKGSITPPQPPRTQSMGKVRQGSYDGESSWRGEFVHCIASTCRSLRHHLDYILLHKGTKLFTFFLPSSSSSDRVKAPQGMVNIRRREVNPAPGSGFRT